MAVSPDHPRLAPYLASSEPNVQGWYDAFCPLHDDDKRSAGFNFSKDLWRCQVRCGGGSLTSLLELLESRDANDFVPASDLFIDDDGEWKAGDPAPKRRRQNRPAPTEEVIAGWVSRLQGDEGLLSKFQDRRGITPDTLKQFRIGYSDEDRAYTIPIWDADGELVNVRLYRLDDEQGTTKIWSWGGEGMDASAIYPASVLKENDAVLLVEGEWDALIANQEGVPAVTGTTGAKQWMSKWNHLFSGKDVYLCYDRDEAGDEGMEKVERNLTGTAHLVARVELPLEWRPKGGPDVTDFIKLGGTGEELVALMEGATIIAVPKDGVATPVNVKESFNPALYSKPMEMVVSVVGKGTTKHLIPAKVSFSCNMNADKLCHGCPMQASNGHASREVAPSDPVVLRLRDVSEKVRDDALREWLGARKCGKMETHVKEMMSTELLVVRNSIDRDDEEEGSGSFSRTIVNVGGYSTDANRIVRLVGTTYPSPKEQESVFQAWDLAPVESSLDTYEVTEEDVALMRRFQPARRQNPLNKMKQIALDLADNVTFITGRGLLHMALDLVWHSVITFDFDGRTEDRGWLELLVIGDERTGKSDVAKLLTRHYGFGRVVSCESASIPGLLGAVKPMPGNKAWTLEWGAIPLNDRRMVVLDEAGGLSVEQIGQLSSLRSSGIAEIIKAETEQTNARTRLAWLANPRQNEKGIAGFTYGVQAIGPLIGNREDIARFDFAMSVSQNDVPMETINRPKPASERQPHVYTAEACHALIRWVWSRRREDIVWAAGAVDEVYESALDLGKRYIPDPPLIQGQNIRIKLARLAAAIAARTFSTDETNTKVVIQKVHVQSARMFLDHLYGAKGFGYKRLSDEHFEEHRKSVAALDEVDQYLESRPGLRRFLVRTGGRFRRQQMEEMLNYTREEATIVIAKLNNYNMVESSSEWDYRVLPLLHALLRKEKS